MILADFPPWFLRAGGIVFGLLWGSFLNVVIWRVPRGMSVVRPGSHCPGCGKPIAPYDNIPVLSYLILRGRARCCGAPYSVRYPLVEALGGLLGFGVAELVITTVAPGESAVRAFAIGLSYFALCMGLVAAAFIDAEHMFLPDSITYGGTVLGIATASLRGQSILWSAVTAAGCAFCIWFPFIFVYRHARGRAGMGLGDAKLMMLVGAWFGVPGALFVLLAGSLQGSLYAGAILLLRGKIEEPQAVRDDREELERMAEEGDEEARQALADDPLGAPQADGVGQARIPFGPFLILGILEFLFFGEPLLAMYGRTLLGV
jgi:leader peptidase (prepilin peptidase)/N-methyltransferase